MLKSRLVTFTLASLVAAFAMAPAAHAAPEYLLEIEGIVGESTVVKDTINVHAFKWGAQNEMSLSSRSGGAGAGKATFNTLFITKSVDVATPALFERLALGQIIPSMELVARSGNTATKGGGAPFMRYCFRNVFVTSQTQSGASGGDLPEENLEFQFGSVSQQYTRMSQTGAPMNNVFSGWDRETNVLLGGGYSNNCGGPRL